VGKRLEKVREGGEKVREGGERLEKVGKVREGG